jgi:hypothetical protein
MSNYADRHRHGEPIASGFVESAVNQVVSKRLVKRQQMRWTMNGAHPPRNESFTAPPATCGFNTVAETWV